MFLYILLGIIGALLLITFILSYVCFRLTFYSKPRRPLADDEYDIPAGKIYEEHRDEMVEWIKMTRSMKSEAMEIKSDDGLTLRGKYYECQPGAPVELLFNGYKGNAERDLSGGVERCFSLGRNVIIINQRASGNSDGNIITFGVKEHKDMIRWAEFASERFGKETPIIIGGVSMGGATACMAAGEKLPDNVVCALSDCSYSSAKAIIKKVVREMKLPSDLIYPFIRLGGMIFGHFDVEKNSPEKAVAHATVPIIFMHGDTDDFVPHEMSMKLYDLCSSEKSLHLIKGAGHGLAFVKDKEYYLSAVHDFENIWKKNDKSCEK